MTGDNRSQEAFLASLVDIRDVRLDPALPAQERIRSFVHQIKNPYLFRVGDTVVRVSYAETDRTMNESFANMIAAM